MNFYGLGTKRIVYKSQSFLTGLTVTCYIWDPNLVESALKTLTEVSDGLYYLDYNFTSFGTWFGIFYENGVKSAHGTFRIVDTSGFGALHGAGAITFTYTLTNSEDGLPIADADIWVTTDSIGNNVVASGKTNQYGKVTFYLDVGTIYVWRQKSGWDFVNPDVEVVS